MLKTYAGTSGRQPITPPRGGSLNKAAGPARTYVGRSGGFADFSSSREIKD